MLTISVELKRFQGKLTANIFSLGSDFVIILGGPGDHLGAASLGECYNRKNTEKEISSSVSTITSFGHRDNKLTEKLSYILSKDLKTNVLVVGGVHIDDINKEQLAEIIEQINPLASKIIEKLSNN